MTKYRIKVETLRGKSTYTVQLGHETYFMGELAIEYTNAIGDYNSEAKARDVIKDLKQCSEDREATVTAFIEDL